MILDNRGFELIIPQAMNTNSKFMGKHMLIKLKAIPILLHGIGFKSIQSVLLSLVPLLTYRIRGTDQLCIVGAL